MKVSFISQPYENRLADWLEERLADPNVHSVRIATAWIKRSALSRLSVSLSAFKQRAEILAGIIGIDEGGATRQGLELALDLFKTVHVFHDPNRGTFHPKMYLAYGNASAHLLVGSNNLTAGGLWNNYEAALLAELDFADVVDKGLFDGVISWFERVYSDEGVCKLLDSKILSVLTTDPRYQIGDEGQSKRKDLPLQEAGDYDGIVVETFEQSIFGKSKLSKKPKAPRIASKSKRVTKPALILSPSLDSPSIAQELVEEGVSKHWFKRLSASDAQKTKTPNSNPTGNLKLTAAEMRIDRERYFRYGLFGSVNWYSQQTRRGLKEEAIIPFDVVVEGAVQGQYSLKVDHATYRTADQNNVPSWLHWGSQLTSILRLSDYKDAWVVIDQLEDGTYRLEITRTKPV